MKEIIKRVRAVGSLVNMNQAVRLISNLGGTIIAIGDFEIYFNVGGEAASIRFIEIQNGRIVMA